MRSGEVGGVTEKRRKRRGEMTNETRGKKLGTASKKREKRRRE